MPVLVTTTVPLDIEVYDQIAVDLLPGLRAAPGFRTHTAHATQPGTFVVNEVWETQSQHQAFFAAHVAPNLPPGVITTSVELRQAITA